MQPKKVRKKNVKEISIPMTTKTKLDNGPKGKKEDIKIYRSVIGSLLYLTTSRPNILFTVETCAKYQRCAK